MANVDAPRGLRPVMHRAGMPYNGAATRYYVPSSDSTAIYVGGLVKLAGSADADGVPSVTGNVATGDAVRGVVVGVEAVTDESTTYRAASTERYVFVADARECIFAIQEDSVGGALAAANVGNVADLTGFTSGEATTGMSSIEIDSSTASASGDGTQDVAIVGLVRKPDNAIGDNAEWLVTLNNYDLVDGFTGV